jgi:hypothetical protein
LNPLPTAPETQQELAFKEQLNDAEIALLRSHLEAHGWQTRRQICEALSWTERQVRINAEALGSEVVRGQAGFKLTAQITRQDMEMALQAADAALSQSRKMADYGLALKRRLHALIQ